MFRREEGKLSSLTVSEFPNLRIGEVERSRFRNADKLVDYSLQ